MLVLWAVLLAQEPPRPALGTPKPFRAPVIALRKYENGMRVALVPFRATPTARIELVIRAGTADGSVAPLVLGDASVSVNTDSRETVLSVSVLPEEAPATIALLADMVRRPAFSAAVLERLKANAVRRIQLQRNQADWLASARADSLLFPGNAAVRVLSEEQVQAIDSAAVAAFHAKYYAPSRARLYVAGTFDQAAVERAAAAAFADWPRGAAPAFRLPASAGLLATNSGDRPVIQLIDRPGATQARVQVSFPVVDMKHPDQRVLNQINILMGSTQTARLVANIRERHGYSYNIHSRLVRRPGATQWMVAGDITNNVVGAGLQEILSEIARLRQEPPTLEELRPFQSFQAGVLVSENSTAPGILESLRWMDLYGVSTSYLGSFVQDAYAITPEKIRATAARYFRPDRMVIVVVGDRTVLLSQLEAIARVE